MEEANLRRSWWLLFERRPKMRCAVILALVAILASTPACAMFDTSTEIETRNSGRALAKLYDRIRGVTVKVLVLIEWEGAIISKHGTGVIVGRKGNVYAVVTNNHVIETSDICITPGRVRYNVEHPDAGNINASILAKDENRDLACLTFEYSRSLPVAKYVPNEPPLLTDVYHYGFGGLWYKGAFATKGVFSSKSRVWTALPKAWTVTCNVWYGCSGGGVFTVGGRLMGVISVIDIERQVCLPWLVGVVPYSELKDFMGETGFFSDVIAKGN
jgi:S1-C subfamily serine protease